MGFEQQVPEQIARRGIWRYGKIYHCVSCVWVNGFSQQAIAQIIGGPEYVLTGEDGKT